MPETAHERFYGCTASSLRCVLLQPLAKGCIQGCAPSLRYQTRLLDEAFLGTEGDVFHASTVYTIFVLEEGGNCRLRTHRAFPGCPKRASLRTPHQRVNICDLSHAADAPESLIKVVDIVIPLRFLLTSGIMNVCLDLAGLFRKQGYSSVLMIRLSRMGARKQPHYRIVVIEKARARNGRPVEVVGTYNPRTNPASIELKRDRVDYWVSKGAQMSERVGKIYSKPSAVATAPVA